MQIGPTSITHSFNNSNVHSQILGDVRVADNHVHSADGSVRSGDNQGAVHSVSQIVSKLSSSLTAAVESKLITSVFLDECLHMSVMSEYLA